MGLTRVALQVDLYTSSGLIFEGESEYAIRISKYLLCHLLYPYLYIVITPNIELAIVNAPTVKKVIPDGMT